MDNISAPGSSPAGENGDNKFTLKLIAKIGGIAVAISAVLALIFTVWPHLRPGYSPPAKSGKIESVQASPNSGKVSATVRIKGFNEKECIAKVAFHYTQNDSEVEGFGFEDNDQASVEPEANDDRAVVPFEGATTELTSGQYYARVGLFAPNGSELDSMNGYSFNIW